MLRSRNMKDWLKDDLKKQIGDQEKERKLTKIIAPSFAISWTASFSSKRRGSKPDGGRVAPDVGNG